jgi:hypothetical protein
VYIYIYELFLYIDMTSNQSSQSGSAEQLAVWHSAIYSALGTRKNGATEAEIQRLAKTLQRLQSTASNAMDSQSGSTGASAATFSQALNDLGRG